MSNAIKKMNMKDVSNNFKRLINGDKLATRLVDEYNEKRIVIINSDKYELKEEESKDKTNNEDLKNALSYTDFYCIQSVIKDGSSEYYIINVPTTDDFSIKDTNTTMYNIEIIQENCLFTFSKALLVKKQDKNKPAFIRTCLFEQTTMIVFQ